MFPWMPSSVSLLFQYSLRIVGFCDSPTWGRTVGFLPTFSIPCESWGSATRRLAPQFLLFPCSFSIPCESWGSATFPGDWVGITEPQDFQYSLRIVGFCDASLPYLYISYFTLSVFPANRGVLRRSRRRNCRRRVHLSVFPANRGVLRQYASQHMKRSRILSVFPANRGVLRLIGVDHQSRDVVAFSIPCESWGSATCWKPFRCEGGEHLSVFPANRGVLRPPEPASRCTGWTSFQYSLRIVGFCDHLFPPFVFVAYMTFSIPCESWGSATVSVVVGAILLLRCLSVFPANRGVLRPQ